MSTPFRENVVIVTGASRGIGLQIALQLADQGALLALAARGREPLEAVAAACRAQGAQALAVPTDIRDEAQVQQLVARTLDAYGRLDTLIANAGMGYPRLFERYGDLSSLREENALNYLGTVNSVFYALPHLRQSKGRIVHVSSFGALVGIPGTSGYNASKHAARGFLNTLRVELRGTGVSVTVACAGAIRTERLAETMGDNVDKVPTMSPERCAAIVLDAAARRKRQVIMTAEGKLLFWLSLLAPGLVERQLVRVSRLYRA